MNWHNLRMVWESYQRKSLVVISTLASIQILEEAGGRYR